MIAAISIAVFAYASPLMSAADYIWTKPNLPSNIAGVVAGPLARTEDVAYIHEAIAERRALLTGSWGQSAIPVKVVRSAELPLTPAEAAHQGWTVEAYGKVAGATNVLAYGIWITNNLKAAGVDTWQMRPVTFELPGGWLHPSNDVATMAASAAPNAAEAYTNAFRPWRGYLAATNITLRGLAWKTRIDDVLRRLDAYRLAPYAAAATNYAEMITKRVVANPYVSVSADGKSISLVADGGTTIETNASLSAAAGFSVERSSVKYFRFYYDYDTGENVPCQGSPLSYAKSDITTTIGSIGGQNLRVYVPVPDSLSTGGVQRVLGASAIAIVSLYYDHGRNSETVTNIVKYAAVPVDTTYSGGDHVLIAAAMTDIAAAAAAVADLPYNESGFQPPAPEGSLNHDGELVNTETEELGIYLQGFTVILELRPLTTIQIQELTP